MRFYEAYIERGLDIKSGIVGNLEDSFQQLEDKLNEVIKNVNSETAVRIGLAKAVILISTFIFIVIILLMNINMRRFIKRKLIDLIDRVKDLSEGEHDLTIRIDPGTDDELGRLAIGINSFMDKLNMDILGIKKSVSIIGEVFRIMAKTAEHLASSSEEESSGLEEINSTISNFKLMIEALSGNLRKQDQFIETTTAAIEELARGTDTIAENVVKFSDKIKENIQSVDIGKQKVTQSMDENLRLNNSIIEISAKIKNVAAVSEDIDEILKVVSNIVEQTNILSMNANIEAAHAGEYGKGFAIVASEVSKLAEDSSISVKKIEELVQSIKKSLVEAVSINRKNGEKLEEGKKITAAGTSALDSILNNIVNINNMIMNISTATTEQNNSTGSILNSSSELKDSSHSLVDSMTNGLKSIEQIVESMNSIGQITENNAGNSIEIFDLSGKLKSETDNLTAIISQFKLLQ